MSQTPVPAPPLTASTAPTPALTRVNRPLVPIIERTVLFYPWSAMRQTATWTLPKAESSLTDPDFFLEAYFYCSPVECGTCPKPHLKHPAISDATFTILVACPHHPNLDDNDIGLPRNKAVARILPDSHRGYAPNGHLVVIKHPLVPDAPSNATLPIISVVPDDFPYIDQIVRRWVVKLHQINEAAAAKEAAAESAAAESGGAS
ncbi:hypothetical protein DFH06DRAFT_1343929 [Mycena polygramma]|nr:hypothetical protein DFH06DRAFT_1343929 [Mycena polygramma]